MPVEKVTLVGVWTHVRAGLIETLGRFSDADLGFAPFASSWTARETALHIAHEECGEVGYGLSGKLAAFPPPYPPASYPTVAAIIALLEQTHRDTLAYAADIPATAFDATVHTPWGSEERRGEMLWHVIEHEIHHRAELSLMLGMLGRQGFDA